MKISKKLEQKLNEIQKKCSARTIDIEQIDRFLTDYENMIGIAKKNMIGTVIEDCDINAQAFPSAYKWTPESTHFSAEYKNGGWTVTNIWRGRVSAPNRSIRAKLSESAKKALITKFELY